MNESTYVVEYAAAPAKPKTFDRYHNSVSRCACEACWTERANNVALQQEREIMHAQSEKRGFDAAWHQREMRLERWQAVSDVLRGPAYLMVALEALRIVVSAVFP